MKNYNTSSALYSLLFLICSSLSLSGASYYVATNGVDNPENGSISSPFLTIQYGSNQLLPGDSLIIKGGIYSESVFLNNSGTVGMPITLMAFLNETPIIDGTGLSESELLIISSKDHVTIDGLTLQNKYGQNSKGIYIVGECDNISIKNCEIKNIGWTTNTEADPYSVDPTGQAHGLLVNGRSSTGITNVSITDCQIHDIITGNSEALTLVGNVSGFEIAYIEVYDTKNIGIDIAGHYTWAVDSGVDPALNQSRQGSIHHCIVYNNRRFSNFDAPPGIYSDGSKDIIIYNNVVYNNGNGLSVGCENANFTASNITVVNNLVYNNDNQGIYFGSNASNITDCILKNNTFVENGTNGIFYSEISLQNSSDCLITQNILIPRVTSNYAISIFGYSVSNLTVDNNLAYRYGGDLSNIFIPGSPAQFIDTNSILVNPSFTDSLISQLDINLKQNSIAIDKGLSLYETYQTLDINDNYRTVNGKMDLGAAESQVGKCPKVFTIDNSLAISGYYIAQDSIILNSGQLNIEDSITINCPITRVVTSNINAGLVLIMPDGCESN